MRSFLLAVTALMCSTTLFADCREYALQGDWTVFYQDNEFPTSVLTPGEQVTIQYTAAASQFSVELTDRDWKAWSGTWSHECVDGQTVLIGAIEHRSGGTVLVIEVNRVTDVDDLLLSPAGRVKLNQINIHFPGAYASSIPAELRDALQRDGLLASHPGHAHGYD
ncbi:MAG TPA: hypothetical protein VI566_11770 [Xanthomonadales bacterium]|nr:hypothetical protein [Xanthomonadales bacterium]